MKKITALILAVILTAAMAVNALAATAGFPDIKDAGVERHVAVLQMLGVIGGDENGNFAPGGKLTRAAFCKMAVITMGNGDKEALYKNRTIFPDVRSNHWARGFVNLAATGEDRLIYGYADGTFRPDESITFGQAVTILMRILGYSDADAGMLWPEGYMTLAADKGLTDGLLGVSAGAAITRAQAAQLFYNLLAAPVKDGGSYIATLGSVTHDVVVMQLDVATADGTQGAVRTSEGVFKTANGIVPAGILGQRGTLLKNTAGNILTFLPDGNKQLTVTTSQAEAAWLKDAAGVRYEIPATVSAYTAEEIKTYGTAFIDIAAGMRVTFFYAEDGKIEAVYINTSKADGAVVAGSTVSSGSFSQLTDGDTGYSIMKNGAPATMGDIKQYDVVTYDKSARILNVTDFRLTGYYENCWPNMYSPSQVTVMGQDFPVLPSAIPSLSKYKVGQVITFLFTNDLQVAGAVTGGVYGSTAVGIVQPEVTASSAKVKLFNGLVISGDPSLSSDQAASYAGELVTVSSSAVGRISLAKLSRSNVAATLDLTTMKLGTVSLSPALKVFERVGTGGVTQIALSALTQTKISASKILYAGSDYASRISILVLNDVTGDRYTYGFLKEDQITTSNGTLTATNRTVAVINSDNPSGTTQVITGAAFTNGSPGGVAISADGQQAQVVVSLTEVKNVSRSAFYVRNDSTYLLIDGVEFPVWSEVECYNKMSKAWFKSDDPLSDARAFSETLTVYYDRSAADGGKIRMVVAG